MAKSRKHILSPETVKAIDGQQQFHVEQTERLIQDRKDREFYIAPDGGVDIFTNQSAAQRGRALLTSAFVKKVRALNPRIVFEVSNNFPDMGAFYIVENRPNPITNETPWKRHICGIPNGEVWEFHRPMVVEEEIPSADGMGTVKTVKLEGQVPGWRQILLRLIMDEAITPAQAEQAFHISQGRSSANWQKAQVN